MYTQLTAARFFQLVGAMFTATMFALTTGAGIKLFTHILAEFASMWAKAYLVARYLVLAVLQGVLLVHTYTLL